MHLVIVEIVLQGLWQGLWKLAGMLWTELGNYPEVQAWGFLAVFLVGIGAVAWYLPKLPENLRRQSGSDKVPDNAMPQGGIKELKADDSIQRVYTFSSEERRLLREFLHGYEHQVSNWKQYVWLELKYVDCRRIEDASPYVTLGMSIYNMLPVTIKLVKVTGSISTIGGKYLGVEYNLPPLPENYEQPVQRWERSSFPIRLNLTGSAVTTSIWSAAKHQRPILWDIKAKWYIEVFGKTQLAWEPSHSNQLEAIPNYNP